MAKEPTTGASASTEAGASRRTFLTQAGLGLAGAAAGGAVLAACSSSATDDPTDATSDDSTPDSLALSGEGLPEISWTMATSWPTSLVTLFGSASRFADQVQNLTGGRFKIDVKEAGAVVGGTEVLPAVRDGIAEIGHSASYYYTDTNPVQQFGTSVPFGLTQRQQNAWLYEGGGLELLNAHNAEENNIIAFPCGGSGCQMGGWFTKEINTVEDLQGLRMRIPGVVAGTVLTNLGGEQVVVPAGDILQEIKDGNLDAAEFIGPTDDLILGLKELGTELFYYHPGWWEPGAALEVEINLDKWNELPPVYQHVIRTAAAHVNMLTLATYDVLNSDDLPKIKEFAQIREFSPEIMSAFKAETEKVLDEQAAASPQFKAILDPWRAYKAKVTDWHSTAELSYLTQQSQIEPAETSES